MRRTLRTLRRSIAAVSFTVSSGGKCASAAVPGAIGHDPTLPWPAIISAAAPRASSRTNGNNIAVNCPKSVGVVDAIA
jgi:hypothetical protein